jgi:hypothetical protein
VDVSGTDGYAGIGINSSQSGGKLITLNQGTPGLLNITTPGDVDLVTFDFNNYRVGIKTTTPGYDLEVVGTAGLSTGSAWTNTSDSRLKDIHGDYIRGIEEIMKLRPVLFNYKEGNPRRLPSKEEYIGFIAQDVQPVFPEAVAKGADGFLNFNMHAVNVAMVNAIQQQQREIESVKSENQQLRLELQSLKEKLEQIESSLAKGGSK